MDESSEDISKRAKIAYVPESEVMPEPETEADDGSNES